MAYRCDGKQKKSRKSLAIGLVVASAVFAVAHVLTHLDRGDGVAEEVVVLLVEDPLRLMLPTEHLHERVTGERLLDVGVESAGVGPLRDEQALLAERDVKVLHCPGSNLKLGSGLAPVVEMRRRGITVSIGADGAACNNRLDMFDEMRLTATLQAVRRGPGALPARDVVWMATRAGADTLGLGESLGALLLALGLGTRLAAFGIALAGTAVILFAATVPFAAWGVADAQSLPWLDPPPAALPIPASCRGAQSTRRDPAATRSSASSSSAPTPKPPAFFRRARPARCSTTPTWPASTP